MVPDTSPMPAMPASPPEIVSTAMMERRSEKPAKAPARGAAPMTRNSNPLSVRPRDDGERRHRDEGEHRAVMHPPGQRR